MGKKLRKEIENYIKKEPVRFHVPSHKGRRSIFSDVYLRDITELSFSDNLNDPKTIIKFEEEKASGIFHARSTLFTVNGATAAIIASIMSAIKPGEKLLLPTNSHISCYYGAIHAGAEVVPLRIKNLTVGITFDEILAALELHQGIKLCVITNPTYYGCCNDIESICEELKKKNIIVIVDESHGTHFNFSDVFPISALACRADIVVHSGHKTINGLTQTGLIHLVSEKIDVQSVRSNLCLIQSTSPSYVLLLSLIEAVRQLKTSSNILNQINIWYNSLKSELNKDSLFTLLNYHFYSLGQAFNYDPMKIYISSLEKKISGYDLESALESEFAIYSEMSDDDGVLLASGLNAIQEDYRRLLVALNSITADKNKVKFTKKTLNTDKLYLDHKLVLSIREAYVSDGEYKKLTNSNGEISAGFVTAYPPGVPILIPGSLINTDIIATIINSKRNFSGITNGTIKIVRR